MTAPTPELIDIGRFIRARRHSTDASGLKMIQRRRHVSHLTQSEFAELVGVSTVVITQIEQGRYPNLTSHLLKRIGTVLGFNNQDEMFTLGLLTTSDLQSVPPPAPDWLVESIADTGHPTLLFDPAYGIAGWNQMALKMLGELAEPFLARGNGMVAVFDIPEFKQLFADWDEMARSFVSGMRMSYGVHARYRDHLNRLADEQSAHDAYFRELWELDDPLMIPTIEKVLNHPVAGTLRVIQIITLVVEARDLTKVEFLPADDETAGRLQLL